MVREYWMDRCPCTARCPTFVTLLVRRRENKDISERTKRVKFQKKRKNIGRLRRQKTKLRRKKDDQKRGTTMVERRDSKKTRRT